MIYVILMEPENEGNLGACARVMKNFRQKNLVLINPRIRIGEQARCRAKHAQDVLNNALVADRSFLDHLDTIIGTTAKIGTDYNLPRSAIVPKDLAIKSGQKIGILIGREGIGLTNSELKKCDCVVTIPTSNAYATLNISHALAIILYEIAGIKMSSIPPASRKDKDVLIEIIYGLLDKIKFSTAAKKRTQKIAWKRILGKAMLSKREAFSLIGFFKKLGPK